MQCKGRPKMACEAAEKRNIIQAGAMGRATLSSSETVSAKFGVRIFREEVLAAIVTAVY